MSTSPFQGWIEVVTRSSSRGSTQVVVLGFSGQGHGGLPFLCFPRDLLGPNDPFRLALAMNKDRDSISPKYALLLLALCLAIHSPERLAEARIETDGHGKIRLATLSLVRGFEKHAGALENEAEDLQFRKAIQVLFKSEDGRGLVGFENEDGKQWIFLRHVERGQIRITPEVLELIVERLRAAVRKASQKKQPKDDPLADLIRSLTLLVGLALDSLGKMRDAEREALVKQWLGRLGRWVPMLIGAFKAPTPRATLARLFLAIAFGGKPPTGEEIADFLDAMSPEVAAAVEARVKQRLEATRTGARRTKKARRAPYEEGAPPRSPEKARSSRPRSSSATRSKRPVRSAPAKSPSRAPKRPESRTKRSPPPEPARRPRAVPRRKAATPKRRRK